MRLLLNGEWFDAVSSEGQYEAEFEELILSRANSLFPDYHVVSFKTPVESEDGRKIPDLALIERSYRYWWVVEVEMAHHSLRGHVIPQVEVFARGKYGQEHCDYMMRKCNGLDQNALTDMIKGAQPRVLVVVNRAVPNWMEPIHRLDGLVAIAEIFRSGRNQHILRINGDYPSGNDESIVSACRLDIGLPGLLQIDSPASLGIASGEQTYIELDGGLTNWTRLDSADKVWLIPAGRNPLVANQNYQILRNEGQLFFKRI